MTCWGRGVRVRERCIGRLVKRILSWVLADVRLALSGGSLRADADDEGDSAVVMMMRQSLALGEKRTLGTPCRGTVQRGGYGDSRVLETVGCESMIWLI